MSKNKRNQNQNTNRGITLIALVITIIVMLILVAVTISMAVNGGLFEYAGKAVSDMQNAIDLEQELANGGITIGGKYYNSIDEYLGLTGEEEGTVKISLSISGTDVKEIPVPTGFTHIETEGTGYVITDEVDAEGNSIGNEFVWVPVKQGQKLSLKVESEKDIKELKLYDPYGDVILTVADGEIQNTYSNAEIPTTVNGMYMAVATTEEGITQKTLTVKSLYALDTYNDWYITDEYAKTLGYNSLEDFALETVKENYGFETIDSALQAMGYPTLEVACSAMNASTYKKKQDMEDYSTSVEKNGGFYIGRYEAGAGTVRTQGNSEDTLDTIKNVNGIPVSKEGYVPYYSITHSQALDLVKSMYTINDSYAVSLLTGAAWDRTLGWILETKGKSVSQIYEDSGSWGNYYDVTFDITKGKYSENWEGSYTEVSGTYTKPAERCVVLTTGATTRNSVNNIFDLAGNVWEWTLTSSQSDEGTETRLMRGGFCNDFAPVFRQTFNTTSSWDCSVGFRPALYLK